MKKLSDIFPIILVVYCFLIVITCVGRALVWFLGLEGGLFVLFLMVLALITLFGIAVHRSFLSKKK